MILLFSLFIISNLPLTMGTCTAPNKTPKFTRLLTMHYDGPGATNATRSSLSSSYGSCRNVDKNAERMFQFFESFGIDLTIPRQNAFKAYFLQDYDLQPWVVEHQAILGSFYEYGEYRDAVVYRSSWRLIAKRDYHTPNGQLVPKASALHYGLFRVVLPGQEVCIDNYSASPGLNMHNGFTKLQTFHLNLYSELWGEGLMVGALHNRFKRKTLNWVLTFPPEGTPN